MPDELRPCPFCGSVHCYVNGRGHMQVFRVFCESCRCCGPVAEDGSLYERRNEAIRLWNERKTHDDIRHNERVAELERIANETQGREAVAIAGYVHIREKLRQSDGELRVAFEQLERLRASVKKLEAEIELLRRVRDQHSHCAADIAELKAQRVVSGTSTTEPSDPPRQDSPVYCAELGNNEYRDVPITPQPERGLPCAKCGREMEYEWHCPECGGNEPTQTGTSMTEPPEPEHTRGECWHGPESAECSVIEMIVSVDTPACRQFRAKAIATQHTCGECADWKHYPVSNGTFGQCLSLHSKVLFCHNTDTCPSFRAKEEA